MSGARAFAGLARTPSLQSERLVPITGGRLMDPASSLVGMSIRYAANSIILIKAIQISDLMLILGQGLLVIAFTAYFALAFLLFK